MIQASVWSCASANNFDVPDALFIQGDTEIYTIHVVMATKNMVKFNYAKDWNTYVPACAVGLSALVIRLSHDTK